MENEIYKLEYQRALVDIKDKSTMHFKEAEYLNWYNFLSDDYKGNNIEIYEEVIRDIGEDGIERIWMESHSK